MCDQLNATTILCPSASLEWEEVEKLEVKSCLGRTEGWGKGVKISFYFLIILL